MSIELTNLEASRMYDLLAETEMLHKRIAELERVLEEAYKSAEERGCAINGWCKKLPPYGACGRCRIMDEIKTVLGRK